MSDTIDLGELGTAEIETLLEIFQGKDFNSPHIIDQRLRRDAAKLFRLVSGGQELENFRAAFQQNMDGVTEQLKELVKGVNLQKVNLDITTLLCPTTLAQMFATCLSLPENADVNYELLGDWDKERKAGVPEAQIRTMDMAFYAAYLRNEDFPDDEGGIDAKVTRERLEAEIKVISPENIGGVIDHLLETGFIKEIEQVEGATSIGGQDQCFVWQQARIAEEVSSLGEVHKHNPFGDGIVLYYCVPDSFRLPEFRSDFVEPQKPRLTKLEL